MNTETMEKNYLNNPIQILHHLKDAGFTQKQAEAQVEVFTDYIDHNISTKRDLKEFSVSLRRDLKEMEMRMTIKTATIVGTFIGFFSILGKFF